MFVIRFRNLYAPPDKPGINRAVENVQGAAVYGTYREAAQRKRTLNDTWKEFGEIVEIGNKEYFVEALSKKVVKQKQER